MTKQIDEMKAAQVKRDEEYTAQIHKMEVDGIVERTLMTFKAKNGKAVRALLDLEDVKLKDGTIKGLDDQLTKLKGSDPYLFDPKVNRVESHQVNHMVDKAPQGLLKNSSTKCLTWSECSSKKKIQMLIQNLKTEVTNNGTRCNKTATTD